MQRGIGSVNVSLNREDTISIRVEIIGYSYRYSNV